MQGGPERAVHGYEQEPYHGAEASSAVGAGVEHAEEHPGGEGGMREGGREGEREGGEGGKEGGREEKEVRGREGGGGANSNQEGGD